MSLDRESPKRRFLTWGLIFFMGYGRIENTNIYEGGSKLTTQGGKQAMKEFGGDKSWRELQNYLKGLAKNGDKPFDCPLLAVLPEPMRYDYGPIEYPKGTLLCWQKVGSEGIVKTICCDVARTNIILNRDNQMKVSCGWNS